MAQLECPVEANTDLRTLEDFVQLTFTISNMKYIVQLTPKASVRLGKALQEGGLRLQKSIVPGFPLIEPS